MCPPRPHGAGVGEVLVENQLDRTVHLLDERAGHLVFEDRASRPSSEKADAHRGSGNVALRLIVKQENACVGRRSYAGHEARATKFFLDSSHFVKISGDVGVAKRTRVTCDKAHVEVVKARLDDRSRLPFHIGFRRRLKEAIQGLVVENGIEAVLVQVERAMVADGLRCRGDDHLQAHAALLEHEFHGTGEAESRRNRTGDRLHKTVRLALDHTAAVNVGIEHEPAASGVGDAADDFHTVVTPGRTAGNGQG